MEVSMRHDEQEKKGRGTVSPEKFRYLMDQASGVYRFVTLYSDYMKKVRNYGTEYDVTMMEAHLLAEIEEHPGTTVTKQAEYWSRTKGAISQTLTRLVNKGLVYRRPAPYDAKVGLLYPTEAGVYLSQKHREYDDREMRETLQELCEQCTVEEIEHAVKVMNIYIQWLLEDKETENDA